MSAARPAAPVPGGGGAGLVGVGAWAALVAGAVIGALAQDDEPGQAATRLADAIQGRR